MKQSFLWLLLLVGIAHCQSPSQQQSSTGLTSSTTSIYDEDYYPVDIDDEDAADAELLPTDGAAAIPKKKAKTLTFLKGLKNITKEAGDSLKLRCEVSGSKPATAFDW